MTAGEVGCGIDDFGTACRIGKFGDPENKTATPLQMFQPGGGEKVVGFRSFCPDLRERIDELPEVTRAGRRQELLLNSEPIDEERSLVSCLHDGLRERDGSARGLVELG